MTDRTEQQLAMLTHAFVAPHSKKTFEVKDFMITGKDEASSLEGQDLEDYIFEKVG